MHPAEVPTTAALLIIDMQRAIDDPVWSRHGPRNHPNAEDAALRLIASWRAAKRRIFHVRHDSVEPGSTYRPGQPGHQFKPGFEPAPDETVIVKQTGSAFVRTELEWNLRQAGLDALVIAGVITNNSVETTVRHAGALGFSVLVAEDACFTYSRPDWRGTPHSAEEVHAMSLANLDGEYCRVVASAQILAVAGSAQPILPYTERPDEAVQRDPMRVLAACRASEMIEWACRSASVQTGSDAGQGVIDLRVVCARGAADGVRHGLASLGFQPLSDAVAGTLFHGGRLWPIRVRVAG